jgi:hypothetical protein
MNKRGKLNNIKKANILAENIYLQNKQGYQYIPQNLTNEHITHVLGINLPLNESRFINEELYEKILQEQIIYENILKTIGDFAKEKLNKVVTTLKDWKDIAAVLFKVIKNEGGKLLYRFMPPLERRVNQALDPIINKLNSLGQLGITLVKTIEKIMAKIAQLKPIVKLLALIGIGTIAFSISKKIATIDWVKEGIGLVSGFFNDMIVDSIMTAATGGYSQFIGVIGKIIGGVNMVIEFIGDLITKFSEAINAEKAGTANATLFVKENILKPYR